MSKIAIAGQSYPLGHTRRELDRLIEQGRFFGDLTAQVLEETGVAPGMRVLDVGCGAGDVSFLAARMVGPEGYVIGVDRAPEAIEAAGRRTAAAGLANVEFQLADLPEIDLDEPVDALVGRLILIYFPDPAVVLRRLVRLVRPGGIVAFQELDASGAKSEPACDLFETTVSRIHETFTRAGADVRAGLKLARIFHEAGLPAPRMILSARVECGPDFGLFDQMAGLTRSLLPLMECTGIATAAEVDVDTLAERLRDEVLAAGATVVSPSFIGAWTRTGAGGMQTDRSPSR